MPSTRYWFVALPKNRRYIDESVRREHRASDLYAEFAGRATSPRLREVWTAVSAIEADHIELDALAKRYV